MTRNYLLFVEDILEAIESIEKFIGEMDYVRFYKDDKTRSAVVWKIENIGEAAKNIPKQVRDKYRGLPWSDLAKIRDKVRHHYFGVDYEIVWEVIRKRFPAIKAEIERMINDLKKGELDKEKME
ncbi:MAG: DUF86 domain-containing protein [Deltaproteobacteria bacterium]|nr:DUF86 domain-containing protein [Deltaproteobacteria bacterium]